MQLDKKNSGGRLTLVLPASAGDCRIVKEPDEAIVRAGWSAVLG